MGEPRITLKDRVQNALARGVLGLALLVPYKARVRGVGWVMTHLVAPLSGWRTRIRNNLDHVAPELGFAEREAIVKKVPDNVGRTLIEIYSGEAFLDRLNDTAFTGPGVEAMTQALNEKRSLVLLTAHIGNYDAVRGTLSRRGFPLGALYKPMTNAAFNAHYVNAISKICAPVFPTDGRGIGGLIRHLKNDGVIGIVGDVASRKAPLMSFFGKPAHTPLSAAEWALKFDAPLIPVFGLRAEDGLSFKLHVDTPIARGTAEEMMQAYNDAVEAVVRDHMDQWFWIHRRWKTR